MSWIGFALLSALFVSIAAIIEKRTLFYEHAMEYLTVMAIMVAILCLPFFLLADYSTLNLKVILLMYATSVPGAIGGFLLVRGIRHMQMSVSSPLLVAGPAITAILAYLFLGEHLSIYQGLGILVLIVGAYFLELEPGSKILSPFKSMKGSGYTWFITSGLLLYGISSVLDRVTLHTYHVSPFTYMAFVNFFLAINYIVMLIIYHDGLTGIKHGVKTAGWSVLVIAALTVTYRYFQTNAVQLSYVGPALAIKRTSIIFTTIIGGIIFKEDHLKRKSLAMLVMLLGALLVVLKF